MMSYRNNDDDCYSWNGTEIVEGNLYSINDNSPKPPKELYGEVTSYNGKYLIGRSNGEYFRYEKVGNEYTNETLICKSSDYDYYADEFYVSDEGGVYCCDGYSDFVVFTENGPLEGELQEDETSLNYIVTCGLIGDRFYYRANGGSLWEVDINTGLQSIVATNIENIIAKNGYLYYQTFDNAIYRADVENSLGSCSDMLRNIF